jgi:hypothetical protein
MSTTIQITTDNYDGQTEIITFTPDNGVFINVNKNENNIR